MANIKDALLEAYTILEFAPQEIDEAVTDIVTRQQMAAIDILMNDLTQEEAAALNKKIPQETQEDGGKEIETLFLKRRVNDDFNAKIAAAMSGVLAQHIDRLKMMGDDAQRTRLKQVFRGIDLDK